MKRICLIFAVLLVTSLCSIEAQDDSINERPKLIVHYMPWYQTPDTSGYWGWHWTMDFYDPDQMDENGNPEIASHYMPLTGPYDSQDKDILEYQVLLMAISGIDGVVVDWYGTADFRDYAINNLGTQALFEYTQKAGLEFAIAYEDVTVKFMVSDGYLDTDDVISHGQAVMQYASEHWFEDLSYLRYQDQPLLFVFGPQYYRDPAMWESLFTDIENKPALVTLDGHLDWAALSSYPWPPMNLSGGAELVLPVLEVYLSRFYENIRRGKELIVGSAFPGFHDIYEEAGIRSSYGYLDAQNGETFRYTLEMALENDADIIQIVTWNDYGEGTMVEPTTDYGYRYLEILQETRRILDDDSFIFTPADLELPLQLYRLRKQYPDDEAINAKLDMAFEAIIRGDVEEARNLLQ